VTSASAKLTPLFAWNLSRPFRGRAALVLALMVMDSVLASIGIGMIVPIAASVLAPAPPTAGLAGMFGLALDLPYGQRVSLLALITLAVFALKAGISMAHAYLSRDFAERMRCFWIKHIGDRYLFGAFAVVASRRQGAVVNDWFNEPGGASRFLLAYMGYLSSLLLTICVLLVSLLVEWMITVAFVVCAVVLGFALHRGAYGRIARLSATKLQHHQALGAAMSESIGQLREMKLLGIEEQRSGAVLDLARHLSTIYIRLGISSEAPRIIGEFVAVAIFVAALTGLVIVGKDPTEIVPLLAFFFVAFYRLVTAGMQVVAGRIKALADLRSAELVHELSAPLEAPRDTGKIPISKIETDIELKDVDFAYPGGELVLRGVSFTIPRAKLTFLVGSSGAGKSTILDLLLRLYSPNSGRIIANSRSIDEFQLSSWRSRLGYVSQDAALFHGSIRANLAISRMEASESDIAEACDLAGVSHFLAELPAGMDTLVGHRGYALSGGQAKRIAIARMLVRKPDFLILDEATSAFEQAMEDAIIARVRARYPDMGVLQVSHRLDSARLANQVVVLEKGRIAAAGPWNEVSTSSQEYFASR